MHHFNPIQTKWVVANTNKKCLIVTTINPIWHSHPVYVLCSLKSKDNIFFAHNYISIQNTNQASHCLDFYLSIIFLVKELDTSNQLRSIVTLIVQPTVSAV